jgi:hypothetical protein
MGVKRYDIATGQWVDYRPRVNQGNNTVPDTLAKRVFRSRWLMDVQGGPDIHEWQLIADYIPPEIAPSGVSVSVITPTAQDPRYLRGQWSIVYDTSDVRYGYGVTVHFMDEYNIVRAVREFMNQGVGTTESNPVEWNTQSWQNFVRARFWYRNVNGIGTVFADATMYIL